MAEQVPGVEFKLILRLAAALRDEGVEYVLIGGVALNLQGIARVTRDIDLMVRPERSNIERLKAALHRVWDDPSIDLISTEELVSDYPAVQYGPPEGDTGLDIMTRVGEAFQYADIDSETRSFDGVPITFATARTLYRMKCGTVRLQDRADAEALRSMFEVGD